MTILRNHYVTKPSIRRLLRMLTWLGDDESKAMVAEVITRNPDRKVQAAAYKEQIADRESIAQFADIVRNPKRLEMLEKAQGKDHVKSQLVEAERARIELQRLKNALREKYGDLLSDLSIGNAAPELKIQAVDGKEARLSALKGKVVVLDIWTTWCMPCKAMIPHEREMVERLKDKPFALVSISADEKKQTLTDFLSKEKMPWTHWWNGHDGGVLEDWDVRIFPTIYVLDTQGVIRQKDLRGGELEKAVVALIAEAEKQSARTSP